jgi:hypothetical protein
MQKVNKAFSDRKQQTLHNIWEITSIRAWQRMEIPFTKLKYKQMSSRTKST